MTNTTNKVDLLILGAGWTSTFLIPLCREQSVSYAATTRAGSADTFKFDFVPESDDPEPYSILPEAKTVLITFPITLKGASERLLRLYKTSHAGSSDAHFIQLGTTSVWPDVSPPPHLTTFFYFLKVYWRFREVERLYKIRELRTDGMIAIRH
jgi:hypothetical protein